MKKLFTIISGLLFAASAMNAQNWQQGQDVSDELEWEDYSGSTNNGAWKTVNGNAAYSFNEWEMFNNPSGAEFYQIFHLPAGVYSFKVQGFYRGNYNPAYWEGTEKINAEFFAESVTLDDETGEVKEITRSSSVKMSSIASSERTEGRLFTYDDWPNDVEYAYNGTNYYVPNSMEGTRVWFNAGYYNTNTLRVIQVNDGYVKIGLRKTDTLESDWLIFSNFHAIFENTADEAVLAILAEEDFKEALETVYNYSQTTLYQYPALQAYLEEVFSQLEDKYSSSSSADEFKEGTDALNALLDEYKGYYLNAHALTTMIKLSENTCNTTDYAGKAAFQAAIDNAKKVEGAEFEDGNTTSAADYSKAFEALATARAEYAISNGQQADGSYDFTSIIAYPFFCAPQYNPTWSKEENRWIYPDEVYNGNGTLQGWNDLGESGDGDNKTYVTNTRLRLGEGVTIGADTTSVYSWYQTGTSGYEPYWNHKMTSAKQWSMPGNRREIVQNLIGLPAGYYSAKAMGITWSNDWENNADLGIYIQSNGQRAESKEDVKLAWWWGYDVQDWTKFSTDMVLVNDGSARVAFHANGFSSFTGMQLFYYGENPDFSKMVQQKLDEITPDIEKLVLKGDKAAVNQILSSIQMPVAGYEAYSKAIETIAEAQKYITTATNYLDTYDVSNMFATLSEKYEEGTDQKDYLTIAFLYTFDLYDGEETTYLDIAECLKDYNEYVHYLDIIDTYSLVNNDDLKTKIAEQASALKDNFSNSSALVSFEKELAAIYNKAVMADLGMENATEENPVDITTLIVNPSFTDGQKGWTGNFATDTNLQNSEAYNTNFRIEQTIHKLPAGIYQVSAQAFYRDGGLDEAYDHFWFHDTGEFIPNLKLFANKAETDVVSLCNEDAIFNERSFTEYTFIVKNTVEVEEGVDVTLRAWMEETSKIDEETGETVYTVTSLQQQLDENGLISAEPKKMDDAWIYDAWKDDGGERYFYPNSMRGGAARFSNDGGAYNNKVTVVVPEGASLTFGLYKNETISNDWCLFDNFKLLYMGPAKTTADVTGDGSVNISDVVAIINHIAGVELNEKADVTGDGSVNISDVVKVINEIAGVQ